MRTRQISLLLVLALLVGACSAEPSPSASVPADCREAVDGALTITASSLQFDAECLVFPADESVTVTLENDDSQSHNFAIYTDSSKSSQVFSGEIIDGGESIENVIDALEAGTYYFDCSVHPGMSGSLIVE
jgi:plastocyanin